MSEERPKDTNIKSTIEAVTGLVQAVPIYQDALQPAAKQIGASLETVTKVVNIALLPLRSVVWGYEQIGDWLTNTVAKKLSEVPQENIVTPPLTIAGPTVDAMRYSSDQEELRELYANLIATSMNKETAHKAHPGYVDIIKNITTDEVEILKCFVVRDVHACINVSRVANKSIGGVLLSRNYSSFSTFEKLQRKDLAPSYLDNLCRVGILEIPEGLHIVDTEIYRRLEDTFNDLKENLALNDSKLDFQRRIIRRTSYGEQFIQNVVKEFSLQG
jgi:hypothetical protein